jgi:hypothetical protein
LAFITRRISQVTRATKGTPKSKQNEVINKWDSKPGAKKSVLKGIHGTRANKNPTKRLNSTKVNRPTSRNRTIFPDMIRAFKQPERAVVGSGADVGAEAEAEPEAGAGSGLGGKDPPGVEREPK